MILGRIIAAITLVLLAIAPTQAAAEAISLDGETSVDSMGAHTVHLADPDAALTFADALDRLEAGAFQPIATTHFEAGYSMAPHWLATEVHNSAGRDAAYRLLTNLPFAPAISIMLVRSGDRREMLLEKHLDTPWRADQFNSLAVATPAFQLTKGETALILTRFHPYGVGILPMTIETEFTAKTKGADMAFMRALFYGFALTSVFMLILYVLAVWRSDGVSLILSLITGVLMMAQIDGILNAWVWPNLPHWNKVASFPLLILLCASMFLMAHDTFRSVMRNRLAGLCGYLLLTCIATLGLMLVFEAATLILLGFVLLILGLTLLGYGSISVIKLIPSSSKIPIIIGAFIFVGVSALLAGGVAGIGDIGAQNLLTAKIMYVMMTTIFITSYAARLAGLARMEANYARRELQQAQNEASISAALLTAERNYSRAREEALHQTRRLENVSHDLRQPLSALRMSLEPLLKGGGGQSIKSAIEYLEGLISAQLDSDDITRPAPAAEGQETVEAHVVINASAVMFADAAAEKGLTLRHRSCSGKIAGPPIQLMRIVNNLVSNAVRHTEAGGVLVAARDRGRNILIEVYDTGPGMAPGDLERFVERHQKGEASDGDGLGLAICFELASRNNYALTVKSVLGKGTRFTLETPAA